MYKTQQEALWASHFGEQYIQRNNSTNLVSANISLFSSILKQTNRVKSIFEIGANVGLNLQALHLLLPDAELSGLEINHAAFSTLNDLPYIKGYYGSALDFEPDYTRDLVFTKGVLIHINPDCLLKVYDLLYNMSSRYMLICEYYNPTPITISYRGNDEALFKRDFAGEIMDGYPCNLVGYGFVYHKDVNFPCDDLTWFLLEKCDG